MRTTLRRVGVIGGALATLAIATALPASAAGQPAAGQPVASQAAAGQPAAPAAVSPSAVTSQVTAWSGDFIGTGVNIRKDPYLNAPIHGQGNRGDGFTYIRGGLGDVVVCPTGIRTADWWFIENNRTGVRGWISACFGSGR